MFFRCYNDVMKLNMDLTELEAQLKRLATAKHLHNQLIFEYLSKRETHREFTDLYTLTNLIKERYKKDPRKKDLDAKAVLSLFERLEQLGVGEIDKSKPRRRFGWHYETKSVGKCALGQSPLIQVQKKSDHLSLRAGIERHNLNLANGRVCTIEIPSDLTQKELERIKSLLDVLIIPTEVVPQSTLP